MTRPPFMTEKAWTAFWKGSTIRIGGYYAKKVDTSFWFKKRLVKRWKKLRTFTTAGVTWEQLLAYGLWACYHRDPMLKRTCFYLDPTMVAYWLQEIKRKHHEH